MNFASDNWAGATPEVMAALGRANDGFAPAYGNDALTQRVTARFAALFEREVEVWFTATGTASNSLGLAALSRPGGLVLCSSEAHITTDEWGATEFQSGGMKLIALPQVAGKLQPQDVVDALGRYPAAGRFGTPVALSLTNATELGTVYRPAEIAALTAPARAAGLAVHLDGARFGNAVVATGASPADLTWRSGVDLMSFGGTKNGCWAAEAIVVFAPDRMRDLAARRQRAGQTFSKARFVAAQFEAYLDDGNWLRWARHANAMAERLRAGLRASNRARLGWESEANEVFAVLPGTSVAAIRAAGGSLHEWPADSLPAGQRPEAGETLVRLVTSWASSADEVGRLLSML